MLILSPSTFSGRVGYFRPRSIPRCSESRQFPGTSVLALAARDTLFALCSIGPWHLEHAWLAPPPATPVQRMPLVRIARRQQTHPVVDRFCVYEMQLAHYGPNCALLGRATPASCSG